MVQINFATREVQCKVVYYGPPRSGKTANLRSIHERLPDHVRGQLTSIATDTDRTLFFDFLPLDLGQVAKVRAKIQLYAVPYLEGQNTMRVLVLEGVDGIVFVADACRDEMDRNAAALANLNENLRHIGRDPAAMPLVFQWNKSDQPDAATSDAMERALNPDGRPAFRAVASEGSGVMSTLKAVTQAVLVRVAEAMEAGPLPAPEPEPAEPARPQIVPTALPASPLPPDAEEEDLEQPASPIRASVEHMPLPDAEEEAAAEEGAEQEALPALGAERRRSAFEKVFLPAYEGTAAVAPEPAPDLSFAEAAPELAEPAPEPASPEPPAAMPAPAAPAPAAAPERPAPPAADPWQGRRRVAAPVPLRAPPPAGAPREVDYATVGRPRRPGWEHDEGAPAEIRLRDPSPVVDRRRRPRHDQTTITNAALAAGALFAVVGLSAVGYLVHALF